MGRMAWGATTPRVCLGSVAIGKRLWRSRAVEKSQNRLSHRAWKSRPKRGIPTSPQPRRRRVINRQPDNSLATKTGPFNLLRTETGDRGESSAATRGFAIARGDESGDGLAAVGHSRSELGSGWTANHPELIFGDAWNPGCSGAYRF